MFGYSTGKLVWVYSQLFMQLTMKYFLFYLSANMHDHTIYCLLLIICCFRNTNVQMISDWKKKSALNPASAEFWAEITPAHTHSCPHLRNSVILLWRMLLLQVLSIKQKQMAHVDMQTQRIFLFVLAVAEHSEYASRRGGHVVFRTGMQEPGA